MSDNKGFSVAFTDGDLQRLKEEIKAVDGSLPTQFEALLCRLEAAEKLLIFSTYNKNESALFQEWRKAAGK